MSITSDEASITAALLEACKRGEHHIIGEHAQTVAQALAMSQPEHHAEYWNYLRNWAGVGAGSAALQNAVGAVWDYVVRFFNDARPYGIFEHNNGYAVVGTIGLPVITANALEVLRSQLGVPHEKDAKEQTDHAYRIVATGVVAYLAGLKVVIPNDIMEPFKGFQINIVLAAADVAFQDLVGEQNDRLLGKIAHTEKTLEDHINAHFERMKSIEATADQVSVVEATLQSLQRTAQEFSEGLVELKSRQDAALERLHLNLERFEDIVREELGLTATKNMWDTRAVWAAVGFYASGVFLLIMLIGIPTAAFYFRQELLGFVATIEGALSAGSRSQQDVGPVADSLATIGRFLLISAPLGFIVWMIRLIVRYNMRSMLLMDDARQRLAILETYLFLVKRDGATKADRGAVLEALFRRPPGHGPDTAEPPNFVDLLKYGQESGGKSG